MVFLVVPINRVIALWLITIITRTISIIVVDTDDIYIPVTLMRTLPLRATIANTTTTTTAIAMITTHTLTLALTLPLTRTTTIVLLCILILLFI